MEPKRFYINFFAESVGSLLVKKEKEEKSLTLIMRGKTHPHYPGIQTEDAYRQPATLEISTQRKVFTTKQIDTMGTQDEFKLSIGYLTFEKDFVSYIEEKNGDKSTFGSCFYLWFQEEELNDLIRNYLLLKDTHSLEFVFCLAGNLLVHPTKGNFSYQYNLNDIDLSQQGALLITECEYRFLLNDW